MSQLLILQIDVVFTMWTVAQDNKGYTKNSLFDVIKHSRTQGIGHVSERRLDIAIDQLTARGHIEVWGNNTDGQPVLRITTKGIEWLEDWYRIEREGNQYIFYRRREGPVVIDQTWNEREASLEKVATNKRLAKQSDDPHFWTKWGTILTGLSILVAVILAVIL